MSSFEPGVGPMQRIDPEELADRLAEWSDMISAMGRLDFGHHARVNSGHQSLDTVAAALNRLGEGLHATTVTRQFVNNILQSMGDALVVLDTSSVIRLVNNRTESITGFAASELVGRPVGALLENGHEAWMHIAAELASGGITGLELQLRTRTGATIPIALTATLLRGERTGEEGIVMVAKDITERKALERELARARDEALQSARLKSQFVANMSHEIRTPLNGVLGMTSLLRDTPLSEQQRQYADTIAASANTLLDIINDILDFSKIEAGKMNFESTDFSVAEVIEDVLELMSVRAHQRGVELVCRVDRDVPHRLRGDPGRVRQVVTNLVNNAIKFTERGEVEVHTSLAEVDGEQRGEETISVQVDVVDTGVGIPAHAHGDLFEPFTQVDGSTTRQVGGTGLGLAICRQLVEAMGGQIGFVSQMGQGSTFSFTMQLRQGSQAAEPPPLPESPRVLVVDDNHTAATSMEAQLESWGARPSVAHSGDEALELLALARGAGDPFRLLVLDLNLAGESGLRVASRAMVDTPESELAVLLLTSIGESISREVMRSSRIGRCMSKPVKSNSLRAGVAELLSGAQHTPPAIVRAPSTGLQSATFKGRGLRVLVADDNPINQRVAAASLAALGIHADVAANGAEALYALQLIPYDIILMDCQMPEMDGYEATRAIRARQGGAPMPTIIAMTAHALAGERERCLEAGMDDYLAKPFRTSELVEVLARWVGAKPESDEDLADTPVPGSDS